MKNLTVLLLLSLLIYSTYCKKKNGKKKESEKLVETQNICNEENEENTLICQCNPSEINLAKEAVCLVYGEKISGEDPIFDKFASQPNLEKLKFSIRPSWGLVDIPTKALMYLDNLQSIEIKYGTINVLPPFVFSNLTSITEISIPQNHITVLKSHAIANLPSLSSLDLDRNQILELKRDSIRDVPSLRMLFMNQNNLSIIHDYAFSHLHMLEELELNTNQISVITKETFVGLKSLRYLDLRQNRLTMIGDFTFEILSNLDELVLEQNNIQYISEKAFSGLKKLTKLRLNDNQLKRLEGDLFSENPGLFLLNVQGNGLEMIAANTLQPLWENLKNYTGRILVERNRLKCDCHISWIYSLRNETVNEDFKKSLEELTCLSSESKPEVSTISVSTEKPQEDQPYSADTDSAQYGDEEVDYEEDVSSLDYDDEEGGPPRQKIFDIPIENLPCPEMQKASTEIAAKSSMSFLPEASSSNFNSAQRFRISFFFVICLAALVL